MIKQIVLCGVLVSIFSYGNALGTAMSGEVGTSGCCSGNMCVSQYLPNCKTCKTSAECGSIQPSTCPDECPNMTWTLVSNGLGIGVLPGTAQYETRCVIGTCQYQCHSGSYGNPSSSSSGCSRCPAVDAAAGGMSIQIGNYGESESGSKSITDCYMAAGSYKDSTGTYTITDDCYYKN